MPFSVEEQHQKKKGRKKKKEQRRGETNVRVPNNHIY